MKYRSAGRDPLIALGAGATGGAIFALGLCLLDIGGLATLLAHDREAITVAMMAAPLLALFAISGLATLPPDEASGEAGRLLRSLRPAEAVAGRRRRRPPRG
jgi:hypothetical protein